MFRILITTLMGPGLLAIVGSISILGDITVIGSVTVIGSFTIVGSSRSRGRGLLRCVRFSLSIITGVLWMRSRNGERRNRAFSTRLRGLWSIRRRNRERCTMIFIARLRGV